MSIQKLSRSVQDIVQAGPIICDATQCVLELVYNALDSGASSIAVRLNLPKYYLQVVDNGFGIGFEDFQLIGENHVTSKCSSVEQLETFLPTFGYRGCSLAAIARTSTSVELQTRHFSSNHTYKKVLKDGKIGEIEMCNRKRPAHGTTVTVNDLLGVMPVRQRRVKDVFDVDDILNHLESLAVLHCDVSFSLRNDSTGKILLQTHRGSKPTLEKLYGLADKNVIAPVRYNEGKIEVSGYICRELHTDTLLQLIYINKRIVHKTKIHKLVIQLMKKYGKFWEKDRNSSDVVVDIDGYVFVLNISLPYQTFAIDRLGRKTEVQLQNAEEVLKVIHRAVKGVLKNNGVDSSIVDVNLPKRCQNEKEPSGRGFGPSQLKDAVRGQQAVRKPVETEVLIDENDQNLEVTQMTSKIDPLITKETLVREKKDLQIVYSGEARLADCRPGSAYLKEFFKESSGEGTALAENAPIYELDDFNRLPFHDFMSWLQVKAPHDPNAKKLLAEFVTKQCPNVVYLNQPAPLVPLKELRQERLAESSREMLCKIKQNNLGNRQERSKEPNGKRLYQKRTTTILRGTDASHLHTWSWPQVSFREFITWLKLKAKRDGTVNKVLEDFYQLKRKMPQGQLNLRKDTLIKNGHNLRADNRQEEALKSRNSLVEPSEVRAKGKRKTKTSNCENPSGQKRPRLGIDTSTPLLTIEADNTLLSTWQSHYRAKQVQVITVSSGVEKPETPEFIAALEHVTSKELLCDDVLQDSDTSSNHPKVPGQSTNQVVLNQLPCNEESPIPNKKKDVGLRPPGKASNTLVLNQSPKRSPFPPTKRDVGVQVNVTMVDAAVLAKPLLVSTCLQACPSPVHFIHQYVQTEGYQFSEEPPSSDLPCGQKMPHDCFVNNENARTSLIGALNFEKNSDVTTDCTEAANIHSNVPCNNLQKEAHNAQSNTSTENPANSLRKGTQNSGLSVPSTEKTTDVLRHATMPSVEDVGEDIADTVPVEWQEHINEDGKKYFVHSVSGWSSFNPPTTSSKTSFKMHNMLGGVAQGTPPPQVVIPTLNEGNLTELQSVISESCEDYLANVKWIDCIEGPKSGSNVRDVIFNKMERSSRHMGDLHIPTASVAKQEAAIHRMLSSYDFTKKDLQTAKVIGQLDKKFIVTLLRKPGSEDLMICLFDQHAVDERITLERLMQKYKTEESCESERLDVPLLLVVNQSTVDVFKSAPDRFAVHGLELSPKGSQALVINSVPSCFSRKQERESLAYRLPMMKRLVADLVQEVVDHMKDTRGAGLAMPKTLFNVIASEACRSAIKFNQALSHGEMSTLLMELTRCRLPFQCAHGRPSMVPIIDVPLENLTSSPKLNLKKFKRP